MTTFWRARADGIGVTVKLQPKSRRPGIQGQALSAGGACLRIGVNQPAQHGQASRAACPMLARALHGPPAAVTVALGQTSRDKTLHVAGDAAHLTARLLAL